MSWATTSSEHWTPVSRVLKHEMSKIVHHIHLVSKGWPPASSSFQQPSLRQVTAAEGCAFPGLFPFFPFTNTSLSPTYVLFYLQSTAPALYINVSPERAWVTAVSILIWINIGNLRLCMLCIGKGWKKETLAPELLRCVKQPPAHQPVWLMELRDRRSLGQRSRQQCLQPSKWWI